MLNRWGRTALVSTLVMGAAAPIAAQGRQTAALIGTVTDASGGVLSGAVITAASPTHIGGPQVATTDARGQYRLTALTPGAYELAVALGEFKNVRRSGVLLSPGFTSTIDFRLTLGDVSQTVVVHAPSPTVDVKSSAVPAVLNHELLQNLPANKNVADLVNLAPGIVNDVAFGAARRSNPVSLDGVSANEPGWGTPFVTPNLNWLEQIQVVSLGASAEHGEFTGARVNAIVQSGSNRFTGLGEYWTTQPGWVGNNRGSLKPDLQKRFKPLQILERWDASAQLGGPFLRDHLWFFAGVEHVRRRDRWASFADVPRTSNEPVSSLRQTKSIAKVTAAPAPSLRLEGFYEHDESTTSGLFAGPLTRPEALGIGTNPQRMWNAHLAWAVSDRTLVDIRHGGHRSGYTTDPVPPGARSGPAPHFDAGTGVLSGNASQYDYARYQPLTFTGEVTHYLTSMLGRSHDLKGGIEHEASSLLNGFGYPGGRLYTDLFGEPMQVDLWDGALYRPSQHRTTLYAQDTWRVNDRVTLNPGVRFGVYRGYVPTKGHVITMTTVSPRAGLAWDLGAGHQTVVRAHYGRYHDQFVTSFYDFLDPLSQTPYIVASVIGPEQYQELYRSGAASSSSIDRQLRHSYVAEALVGVEHELFADFSIKVQVVRRDFENTVAFTDPTSVYETVLRPDPGPDARMGTADDAGSITVYNNTDPSRASRLLTNPNEAFRNHQALQLIGTKRYSRNWQMQASYTWARTHGTVNNVNFSNAANNSTGANGFFINPNRRINTTGRTALDVPHEFKVLGSYRAPWWVGATVSGVYRYHSGRAWSRQIRVTGLRQGVEFVRVEPFGTRRLPAVNMLDLRVEKTFRVGRANRRLGVYVDALNVWNQGVALFVSESSGPEFGIPTAWLEPRSVRGAIRVWF